MSVEVEEGRARWRTAVAGVLAKSSRKDPADLPAEPETLLDSPTYEGFSIRPLYTALDELPESPLPGTTASPPRSPEQAETRAAVAASATTSLAVLFLFTVGVSPSQCPCDRAGVEPTERKPGRSCSDDTACGPTRAFRKN